MYIQCECEGLKKKKKVRKQIWKMAGTFSGSAKFTPTTAPPNIEPGPTLNINVEYITVIEVTTAIRHLKN